MLRYGIKQYNFMAKGEIKELSKTLREASRLIAEKYKKVTLHSNYQIVIVDKKGKEMDLDLGDYLLSKINKRLNGPKAIVVNSKISKGFFSDEETTSKDAIYKIIIKEQVLGEEVFNSFLNEDEINKTFSCPSEALIDFYLTTHQRLKKKRMV